MTNPLQIRTKIWFTGHDYTPPRNISPAFLSLASVSFTHQLAAQTRVSCFSCRDNWGGAGEGSRIFGAWNSLQRAMNLLRQPCLCSDVSQSPSALASVRASIAGKFSVERFVAKSLCFSRTGKDGTANLSCHVLDKIGLGFFTSIWSMSTIFWCTFHKWSMLEGDYIVDVIVEFLLSQVECGEHSIQGP